MGLDLNNADGQTPLEEEEKENLIPKSFRALPPPAGY